MTRRKGFTSGIIDVVKGPASLQGESAERHYPKGYHNGGYYCGHHVSPGWVCTEKKGHAGPCRNAAQERIRNGL